MKENKTENKENSSIWSQKQEKTYNTALTSKPVDEFPLLCFMSGPQRLPSVGPWYCPAGTDQEGRRCDGCMVL